MRGFDRGRLDDWTVRRLDCWTFRLLDF